MNLHEQKTPSSRKIQHSSSDAIHFSVRREFHMLVIVRAAFGARLYIVMPAGVARERLTFRHARVSQIEIMLCGFYNHKYWETRHDEPVRNPDRYVRIMTYVAGACFAWHRALSRFFQFENFVFCFCLEFQRKYRMYMKTRAREEELLYNLILRWDTVVDTRKVFWMCYAAETMKSIFA